MVGVVEAAAEGRYTLLLPGQLVRELTSVVTTRPYLARRIPAATVEQFVADLSALAEMIALVDEPIPAATRDRKDDYLIAYALVGAADYLVTGDDDLLSLGRLGVVRIVSPATFLHVLEEPLTS